MSLFCSFPPSFHHDDSWKVAAIISYSILGVIIFILLLLFCFITPCWRRKDFYKWDCPQLNYLLSGKPSRNLLSQKCSDPLLTRKSKINQTINLRENSCNWSAYFKDKGDQDLPPESPTPPIPPIQKTSSISNPQKSLLPPNTVINSPSISKAPQSLTTKSLTPVSEPTPPKETPKRTPDMPTIFHNLDPSDSHYRPTYFDKTNKSYSGILPYPVTNMDVSVPQLFPQSTFDPFYYDETIGFNHAPISNFDNYYSGYHRETLESLDTCGCCDCNQGFQDVNCEQFPLIRNY